MTERALQSAVFDFLRIALPSDAVPLAVPNGDGRMTTAPGALSGAPDLQIIYRGRPIFIELKTATGRLSPEQKAVHIRLAAAGAVVTVCRSVVEVQEFLAVLIPLRARIAA